MADAPAAEGPSFLDEIIDEVFLSRVYSVAAAAPHMKNDLQTATRSRQSGMLSSLKRGSRVIFQSLSD